MPIPTNPDLRAMLTNLLSSGKPIDNPESLPRSYRPEDMIDLGPELPQVPKPLSRYNDPPVLGGGAELAQVVRRLMNLAPELRRHVSRVSMGPTEPVMKALSGTKFGPYDFPDLNLLGVTDTKTGDIALNPRLAREQDGDYTVEGVLGHEFTHAAGADPETYPEMARKLLVGQALIQALTKK